MTPAARLSAAIELIATIDAQRIPAAKALKEWGTRTAMPAPAIAPRSPA